MASTRQTRANSLACVMACCIAFCSSAGRAQIFDLQPSCFNGEALSELVGYEPTECDDSEKQVSLLAAEANIVSPSAAWGQVEGDMESLSFAQSYSRGLNSLLTPMVPNEAFWREPTDYGNIGLRAHLGLPLGLSRQNQKVLWQAGPLAFDVNSVGVVALHSELKGPAAQLLPDDGFLGALLFNTELMLHVSDSTYIYIRVTPYYIFTENRLGLWLGDGGLSTYGNLSYAAYVRDWEIKLDDRVGLYSVSHDLLELDGLEVDEIAVSGRHRIVPVEVSSTASPFSEDSLYITNRASLKASNWLDQDWKISLGGDRWDSWRFSNLEKRSEINRLGAAVFYESPDLWFLPWASYDWFNLNDSQMVLQQASLGATLPFTARFHAYAKVQGIWLETEQNDDQERPGWQVGLIHRPSSSLSHSVFVANTFFIDEVGDSFVGNYWRYSLRYAPVSGNFSAAAYVAQADNELSDAQLATLGFRLSQRLSFRSSLSVDGAVVDHEDRAGNTTKTFLTRVSFLQKLTPTVSGRLTYQMLEHESSFEERLFMLNLQWSP